MIRKLLLPVVLAFIGLCGTVIFVSLTVIAVRFGELGRVMLYLILALLCVELLISAVFRIVSMVKKK